ncbi:MAG: RbsD/FucU domain-containing protein [Pseudomonadota bacterium]
MLKGLDPLLNADVLYVLRAMGHGDDVVIGDTNFPADHLARQTSYGKLLRIDASAARVAQAILSIMPLDTFADDPAGRMQVGDDPEKVLDVHQEVQAAIDQSAQEQKSWPLIPVERFAFYERARKAYAIIQTGERRFYGCFAFRKGVIAPDAE